MPESFFAVAPTDVAKRRNTLREPLVPFASWQLDDSHFAFDSSLLLPSMTADLAELVGIVRAHPGAKLTIFGHTDPSGQEEYNKTLSGRRAMALYALLTRRTDLWEQLFKQPHGGDDWKRHDLALSTMRIHLGQPGAATGSAAQRAALFGGYMTAICRDADGKPFGLPKSAFLGAGADARGKADYQGCGELNPLLVFSRVEGERFGRPENQAERDAENAPNRRVTVFLFPKDTTVDVSRWPCPRAGEGAAACRKRLWSDAVRRRASGAERRVRPDAMDTMACRFYDRFDSAAPRPGTLLGRVTVFCGANLVGLAEAEATVVDPGGKPLGSATLRPGPEAPADPPSIALTPPFSSGPHRLESRSDGKLLGPVVELDLFGLFLRLLAGTRLDAPPPELAVREADSDDPASGPA